MDRVPESAERPRSERAIDTDLRTLRAEMHLIARARGQGSIARTWKAYGLGASRYLPLSLAPIWDSTLVAAGIAVGWHMPPPRLYLPADLWRPGGRLLMGELVYRCKHYTLQPVEERERMIAQMATLATHALGTAAFAQRVDLVAAVPSSRGGNTLPHRVAETLARATGHRLAPEAAIRFARTTTPSKTARDWWSAFERMHEAMEAHPATFTGRTVLLVDDVCAYGATLAETARACREAGADEVFTLALSKTFAHQRHPDLPPDRQRDTAITRGALPSAWPGWFADAACGFPEDMLEVPFP